MVEVCLLAGGVGAAKLLKGLAKIADVTVIGNVGDDVEMFGLHISPDLDILMYTLAGIVDPVKGWGIKGDTFNCLSMLARYGEETWFRLGDMDLATHILRTKMLREGMKLSGVQEELCRRLGVNTRIIPVTDDYLRTFVDTEIGLLPFQEYFVKMKFDVKVKDVLYKGAEKARPAKGVLESLMEAKGIIVAPSNPLLSIGPILAVKGIREALRAQRVVAISPIVGGRALKGPADRIMRDLGIRADPVGVAQLYSDFLDVLILDQADEGFVKEVEGMGIKAVTTDTVMDSLEKSVKLAEVAVREL